MRVQTVLPRSTFSCDVYVQRLAKERNAPANDTCSASAVSAAVSGCQTLCQRGADALQRCDALRWRRDAPHCPNDVLHFARNELTHSKHEQARRVATHRIQGVAAQYRDAARRHSARLQRGTARRNAAHCNGRALLQRAALGCNTGGLAGLVRRAGGQVSRAAEPDPRDVIVPPLPHGKPRVPRKYPRSTPEYPGVPRSTPEYPGVPRSTPEYRRMP